MLSKCSSMQVCCLIALLCELCKGRSPAQDVDQIISKLAELSFRGLFAKGVIRCREGTG